MTTPWTTGRTIARLLFTHRLASPVWLAVRLYLGAVWLQFGISKLRDGWLSASPMPELMAAIAQGHTAMPLPLYRHVAELLVALGADRVLGAAIPLAEVAIGLAMVGGVLVVPAAVAGCLLNLNLILSGVASLGFDGRIILLQLLLLAAWRVAPLLGLGTLWRQLRAGAFARQPRQRAA